MVSSSSDGDCDAGSPASISTSPAASSLLSVSESVSGVAAAGGRAVLKKSLSNVHLVAVARISLFFCPFVSELLTSSSSSCVLFSPRLSPSHRSFLPPWLKAVL